MNKLKSLGLWILLMPLLAVVSELNVEKWVPEDASGKFRMTTTNGVTEIIAPEGLTLWYNERLTGNYEISYRIQMVMKGGRYDRLSDMNCFWGAKIRSIPTRYMRVESGVQVSSRITIR